MSEELKPCQFCGSHPRSLMGYDYGKVSCGNEHCQVYNAVFSVDKWNARHIPEGFALVEIQLLDTICVHTNRIIDDPDVDITVNLEYAIERLMKVIKSCTSKNKNDNAE